jgi:hypothetical protein
MRWMVLAADEDSGLPAYAYLFWAMFIGYAIWYGLRIYRRSSERRAGDALPPIPPSGPTTTARSAPPRPQAPRPTVDPAPFSSSSSTPPAAPIPMPAGDDAQARTGFFAAAEPTGGRPPEQARRPVAAILRGITMPDALAPVINPDAADPAGMRVAFSASGAEPGRVGRAVGDELERLGFSLRSLGDTELGATRDHDELVVTIYTEPGGVERLGAKAFPTLPPGSFVVEFESV